MNNKDRFQRELEALYCRLLTMSELVESAVEMSVQSLISSDVDVARQVIRNDKHVDIMETEIEERTTHLLSIDSPSVADLRLISTISKVVTDLERIARNATNIAEITVRLCGQRFWSMPDIPRMAETCIEMARDSMQALVSRDQTFARVVAARDDMVDALFASVRAQVIRRVSGRIEEEHASQCMDLLLVARFLERIADHATNICGRVVYLVSGKRVRLG